MMEPQVLGVRGLYLNGALEPALRKAQEILRHAPEDFNMHLLICRCVYYIRVGCIIALQSYLLISYVREECIIELLLFTLLHTSFLLCTWHLRNPVHLTQGPPGTGMFFLSSFRALNITTSIS